MQYFETASILVPSGRQRENFDPEAIAALGNDITANSLYHALLVRQTERGLELVAGERRLRAIKQLQFLGQTFSYDNQVVPQGKVPCILLDDMSLLRATEVELHENILRENLSWQERVKGENRLFELRAMANAAQGLPAPSLASVVAYAQDKGLTKIQAGSLSESVNIAPHLSDPEVAKAGSRKEARKIVERKRQEEYSLKMAHVINQSPPQTRHKLILGDMIQEMARLPQGVYDGIITDPPYGRNLHQGGEQGNASWRAFDDSPDVWEELMITLVKESSRVLKPDAHIYIFCAFENFLQLAALFSAEAFNVWPRPLIWAKGNVGALPVPDFGPRYTYECILYARRGEKKTRIVKTDVIYNQPAQKVLHPDEKPVSLIQDLVERSSLPGEEWLDPFCGSGTIFPVANKLSLKATGIEMNTIYHSIATNRLSGVV